MAISKYHAYQPMARMWFTGRFLEEECDYLNKCPILVIILRIPLYYISSNERHLTVLLYRLIRFSF